MQSVAWSTIFLLVLLLPGFFFYTGLYAPERFARDLAPRNPLGALAATVLISFLVHAGLAEVARMLSYPVDWAAVLEAMQLSAPPIPPGTAPQGSVLGRVAAGYAANPIAIPAYVLASCALGRLTGRIAGSLAVRGWLPSLNAYSWVYTLKAGTGGRLTIAHVLSDVSSGGRHILYRGRLRHFGLNADGTFAYIVLAAAEQRFLLLDGDGVDVPRPGPREPIGTNGGAPYDDHDAALLPESASTGRVPRPRLRDAAEFLFGVTWQAPLTEPDTGAVLMIAGSRVHDVVFQGHSLPEWEPARREADLLLDTLEELDEDAGGLTEETLLRALSAAARERLRSEPLVSSAGRGEEDGDIQPVAGEADDCPQ